MKDPYKILGVSPTASPDEIKAAYRLLAKKHHPDQGGNEEKFKEISSAYEMIKDGKKPSKAAPNQDFRWQDVFDESTFTDDWTHIFANASGFPQGKKTPRNSNIRTNLNVTLESILKDNTVTLQINTGKESKQVEVRIPAGIHDGAVITYRGLGNNFYENQPPGDLLINVNIIPHTRFQRKDDDLYTEVTIDCFNAIRGTQVDFVTLRQKKLRITIPKGCQNGTTLRIANEGVPSMSNNAVGNLFIKINVKIPSTLTQKQLDLVDKIISLNESLNK